ncbi:MAG: Outer membrane porin F precursor [Bacteroidetes bacterium ADurb.Bin397]|jgi:peptidoglycan-associated lipoprotein|nr:MAG: Outer membrane porin F precursor [Bacteroidetes bacterium ADurb.Bin397]
MITFVRKFKSAFYFVAAFFVVSIVFSGCTKYNYRVANNYYEQYAFARAIPNFEKVLRKAFITDAAAKLADSYQKNGNSLKAEIWYKRLVKAPDAIPEYKLRLAEVLMENAKYSEARYWFSEYQKLDASDKRVKRMIEACDSIHLFLIDTTVYAISLTKLNKDMENNFSPAFYRQGIVFLSDRSAPGKPRDRSSWTGKEYLDLFFTRKTDGENWLEPELLKGDINGIYDEGPAVFSKDNTTIYFTRSDYSGKTIEKNQKDISVLKLYYGKLYGNQWKLENQLPFNSPDYSVGHPAISPDGKSVYFVSDMPWGYGGTDLYKVTLKNGQWSTPENLGPKINTEGNEMFPFFAPDSVMYFASDGHIGLGGLDIFASSWDGESWSKVENLQVPVNSSKDDFGFIIDSTNTSGFFSSNRIKNTDKIYSFKRNPPVYSVSLKASDGKTKKSIRSFSLYAPTPNGNAIVLATSVNHLLEMPLTGNTDYKMYVKSNGFYAEPVFISTKGVRKSQVFADSLVLTPIDLKKPAIWRSIVFKGKKAEYTPESVAALDSLVNLLEINPEIQIEIGCHTDSRGSFTENLSLSRKRSDEIAMYLINKGINAPRIISIGYGEGKLLNYCRDGVLCLEEDHAVNNRVEIKILELIR